MLVNTKAILSLLKKIIHPDHNMKISKITISFLLVLSLFLTGCETVKDITDPLDDDNDESNNISSDTIEANVEEINLYFVRPADPLTIGQDVELYVDDDEIGELTYNTKIQFISPWFFYCSLDFGVIG